MGRGIGYGVGGLVALVALVALIGGCGALASYDSPAKGKVGICQSGGPFDDQGTCGIMQPNAGKRMLGFGNSLKEFPATQRNYIISSKPGEGDRKGADSFCAQSKDGIPVCVEGQALFTLNTAPKTLLDFYSKYGTRTFDGKHPYDGDGGWSRFLDVQFRPVLENALRASLSQYTCEQLNPSCVFVTNPEAATGSKLKGNGASANITLSTVQDTVGKILNADLNSTLGGPFFEGIVFRLTQVPLRQSAQNTIDAAIAARGRVSTATQNANAKVEAAKGNKRVADQNAAAIAATEKAYRNNPQQAKIDQIKALCGDDGCDPQVIGGNGDFLLGGK